MLNDEDTDEKAGGDHRKGQRDPERNRDDQVHRGTAGEKSPERGRQLRQAPRQYRRLKRGAFAEGRVCLWPHGRAQSPSASFCSVDASAGSPVAGLIGCTAAGKLPSWSKLAMRK